MLLNKYVSILLMAVCVHVNNPCLALPDVNAEILDAFIDCTECMEVKTFDRFIEHIFTNILYNDIQSAYVRKFIIYVYGAVEVNSITSPENKEKKDDDRETDFPKYPSRFCKTLKRGCTIRETKRNMMRIYYDWSIVSAQKRKFSNMQQAEFIEEYILHIKDTFKYSEHLLKHGTSVKDFCKYACETSFVPNQKKNLPWTTDFLDPYEIRVHPPRIRRLTSDSDVTPKAARVSTLVYKDCIDQINNSFKDCVDCTTSQSYINHLILHETDESFDDNFTIFFMDFLYNAISVHVTEEMLPNKPDSPKKFCLSYNKIPYAECEDIMKTYEFKLNETISSIKKVYYEIFIEQGKSKSEGCNDCVMIEDYLEHIRDNYIFKEYQLQNQGIPNSYCDANWEKVKEYTECTETILNSFEECDRCNDEAHIRIFIDFAFGHIAYAEMDEEYTRGFLNYIYSAVDDVSTHPYYPDYPKEFCSSNQMAKIFDIQSCIDAFKNLADQGYINSEDNLSNMKPLFFDWTYDKAKKMLGEDKKIIMEKYIEHVIEEYFYVEKEINTLKLYCKSLIWEWKPLQKQKESIQQ